MEKAGLFDCCCKTRCRIPIWRTFGRIQ